MKKYIQLFVVVAFALTVFGIARANPAWAGQLISPQQSDSFAGQDAAESNAAQPTHIVVTGSGSYLVGGVCKFEVSYVASDVKNEVDAEVPVSQSRQIPFIEAGDLYFPGCHIVHYKQDKVLDEAKDEDGDWKVCFGKRPDIGMTIFYYLDNPPGGSPIWISLPTSNEGAYACAPALHTGVYMPAGEILPGGSIDQGDEGTIPVTGSGTILPPQFEHFINAPGKYAMGGICILDVNYKENGLSDNFYEEFPVVDNVVVSFPENGDLLFFPGCHVLHYEFDQVQKVMQDEQGDWLICFAAPPGQKITIYYYESLLHDDNPENITPPWTALPTTVKDGLACAPADSTGVYVPAGQ